jgi:hypothetical protein
MRDDEPVPKQQPLVQPGREEVDSERLLRCRQCAYAVTSRAERLEIDGQHLHVRLNPAGVLFGFGCFRSAPGVVSVGKATDHFSWFPGYAWQLSLCGGCGVHLGWAFTAAERSFFGLILEELVDEG